MKVLFETDDGKKIDATPEAVLAELAATEAELNQLKQTQKALRRALKLLGGDPSKHKPGLGAAPGEMLCRLMLSLHEESPQSAQQLAAKLRTKTGPIGAALRARELAGEIRRSANHVGFELTEAGENRLPAYRKRLQELTRPADSTSADKTDKPADKPAAPTSQLPPGVSQKLTAAQH